jgi:hypothetical protein
MRQRLLPDLEIVGGEVSQISPNVVAQWALGRSTQYVNDETGTPAIASVLPIGMIEISARSAGRSQ